MLAAAKAEKIDARGLSLSAKDGEDEDSSSSSSDWDDDSDEDDETAGSSQYFVDFAPFLLELQRITRESDKEIATHVEQESAHLSQSPFDAALAQLSVENRAVIHHMLSIAARGVDGI